MIRRFVQDWLLFAPMAILIALVVSGLLGADIVSPQLQNGALITYGLSFFLAFYEDLPTDRWETQGRGWGVLSTTLGVLHWVVIGLGFVGIAMVFTLDATGESVPAHLALFMTAFGFATVAIAFLVGVGALATRIQKKDELS